MAYIPSTKYSNIERTVTGNVNVEISDQVLKCDTSLSPVTINLLQIPSGNWSTFYSLYIKDLSNNAGTNNITIVAPTGFSINNQQQVSITTNGGNVKLYVTSDTDYIASYNYTDAPVFPITVSRTAFVMKNGSDSTGLVNRFDKPFLTIQSAISALETAYPTRDNLNRCKVIVYTGIYDGEVTLKNFIDLDLNDCTLTNDNGASLSTVIKDAGATFTKNTGDVNVYITGNANLVTYPTHTAIQYPLQINGNGTFIISLNSIVSNVGEAFFCTGNDGKNIKLYFNSIYTYNSADNFLIQPIHILMNTSFNYQGKYELIGGTIEARETTNLRSSILATFPTTSVPTTKYCDLILNDCLVIGNSNTKPTISTLGDNSLEISGNMNLYLLNTRIWNKYSVDSIAANGTGSNLNLFSYGGYSNVDKNANVNLVIGTYTFNSGMTAV